MFFKCPIAECSKLFNCKKALKEHERTHDNNRPFKCESCDQTFTQYSSLQKHARVHDKQKPYPCDHPGCTQAFSQVSNLIRHQRIHTGDKPFKCAYCTKRFASGSNLKQHLQIHQTSDGRSNFECIFEGCKKNYLYQSSLKKHYLVSHKEQYEELLAEQKISTCGFQLNEKGEKIPFQKVASKDSPQKKNEDENEKNTITIQLEPVSEVHEKKEEDTEKPVQSKNEEQSEKQTQEQKLKEEERRRMVEKGLKQSEQIKENPLTQNFAVGKRGRPPNALKNSNALKKQRRDSGSEINSCEQKREFQGDAIKEALAQVQRNRSSMSADEFNFQNEFLALISSLQDGIQGKSNNDSLQIPQDLQKIIKASVGMSKNKEFQTQDVNKLLQALILNSQNQGNGQIDQGAIQKLIQGLGQQFSNHPGNAFNIVQRMGFQPNGNQFAPAANQLPVSQEEQLQYLMLVQNQQKVQQEQMIQGSMNVQPPEKAQEINQAQAINMLPQMSPAQQLNIGGNININLSNINLNQFSIKTGNSQEMKVEEPQQQEPEQFKGTFPQQKQFSLQNFISEPVKKNWATNLYTESKENILNTLQKNKNEVDTTNMNQSKDTQVPSQQQQTQQQTIQQKSKFRQMLADDEALSGQNSDEEDEVEMQVKEPLSAIRGKEYSAVRGKEDGLVQQDSNVRAVPNVKQESNSNSNGNHFYNCQFIISGAQGNQPGQSASPPQDEEQQDDDQKQPKDETMHFAVEQTHTDSKILESSQIQDKKVVQIAIDEAKGQSSIGELVGAGSQNALNNDNSTLNNISKLQNSINSFVDCTLNKNQVKGQEQSVQNQKEKLTALQQLFYNKQSMNSFDKPVEFPQQIGTGLSLVNLKGLIPGDKIQSLDPAHVQDQLKMSSNSLIQDRMRQASRLFGQFGDSQKNFLELQDNLPKAERKLSFLLENNMISTRRNLLTSNANLNNPLENNDVKSKFSSHLNLLQNGGKGMTMAQSNIFDQFQNTKIPSKPPSICSRSNNGRSNPNLLKYSQSLTDVNPQQAQDILRRIQKQAPEQLRQLIQQTQQQQGFSNGLKRDQSNRSFTTLSPSKLRLNASSLQIPIAMVGGSKSARPSISVTPQSATTSNNQQKRSQIPTFLDACKAAEQQQNKSNKKFMQNINKLSKEGKMSGLFNRLHKVQNQTQDIQPSNEVSPLPIVSDLQNGYAQQTSLQKNSSQLSPPSAGVRPSGPVPGNIPDKSGDEFEDDEDQEVDGLFFDEFSPEDNQRNSSLPNGLAPQIIGQDIEDVTLNKFAHPNLSAPAGKMHDPLSLSSSYPLDAMNVQALMENPALTQHLINVLTENLQKQESKQCQQSTQATPVFSYQEIMKKQIQNEKSQMMPSEGKKSLMPILQNQGQQSLVNQDLALNQMMQLLGQNQNIQSQLLTNQNYPGQQSNSLMHQQQPQQEKSPNEHLTNSMMLPVSTFNKKKQLNNQRK